LCLLLLVCAALEQAGNKSHGKEKPRDWRCNTVRGLVGAYTREVCWLNCTSAEGRKPPIWIGRKHYFWG
jgi:hypothetical protein